MRQREIVTQRILTLAGLASGPNGPFAASGGDLARHLVDGWAAERRLLQRLLDETKGDDVRATIALWHDRTTAFLTKAGPGEDSWRDREGNVWVGSDVLRVLEDLRRRIDAWQDEGSADAPDAADPGARRAARDLELAALRESLDGDGDADPADVAALLEDDEAED